MGVVFLQFLTSRAHFFNDIRIENGDENRKYLTVFIMELAQIFGPEAVVEQAKKFGHTIQYPVGVERADLRKVLNYKLGNDREMQ